MKGPGFHAIIQVFCDQTTDGEGRTVFRRRQDDSVDFKRTWNDYRVRFRKLEREFWLGNENIHNLTIPLTPRKRAPRF